MLHEAQQAFYPHPWLAPSSIGGSMPQARPEPLQPIAPRYARHFPGLQVQATEQGLPLSAQ